MKIQQICATIALLLFSAGAAWGGTSVTGSVSRGESHSMAYSLGVFQTYEPWFEGTLGELTPTMELSGHLWVPDDSDDDNVWGVSLAPGLKFVMFTDTSFNPYIGASIGGIAVSDRDMGSRDLGSNVLFKSKGVVGVEFGEGSRHRIQGEYTNYSTWGITTTDDGYSTWGASYGYSF